MSADAPSSTSAQPQHVTAASEGMLSPLSVACAWVMLVVGQNLWPSLAPLTSRLATIGQVVALTFALQLLHELGHVIAGLVVGLPFDRVTVGLFTLEREAHERGWRLRWALNRSWRKLAGCVEREISPAPGMREALTVTALGGPLASMLGGLLLMAAGTPWQGLGAVSIGIGVLNAIPISSLGQLSDGMIVWRLWSRRPDHAAWRAPFCDPGAVALGQDPAA
jgi:hypothetical protein